MFCGGIEGAGQFENGVRSLGIHWAYGPGPDAMLMRFDFNVDVAVS